MSTDTDANMGNDFSFLPTDLVPDWLDDIGGSQALAWARAQSETTIAGVDSLADNTSDCTNLKQRILATLSTDARAAYPV